MSTIHEETNNTGDPELNFETRISDAAPVTDNEQKDAGLLDNAQPDPRSGDITDAEGEDIEQRAQGGVKKSEAMAMAWSAIGLNVAYAG